MITLTGVPGRPTLTVVGVGTSATGTAGGWVVPAQITALGVPLTEQMLYRFANAGSSVAVSADIATVGWALPKAVADAQSWLTARTQETTNVAPWVPFLVAFGLIALVMSVLIVVNVVSGAVSAGTRRIGVLKSVGFLSQFVRPDRGPAMIQVLVLGGIFTILGLAADTLDSCASGAVGNWLAGCPRLLRSDRMLRQLLTSGSEPGPLWPAPRPASCSDHIRTTAPGKPAFRRRSSSYPSAAV